jgi:hypothetical protein
MDTFLELGVACKPELQGKKGGHSERWMISGQETVFLLGFSSLVNLGNYLSCFSLTTYLLTTHKQVVSR